MDTKTNEEDMGNNMNESPELSVEIEAEGESPSTLDFDAKEYGFEGLQVGQSQEASVTVEKKDDGTVCITAINGKPAPNYAPQEGEASEEDIYSNNKENLGNTFKKMAQDEFKSRMTRG